MILPIQAPPPPSSKGSSNIQIISWFGRLFSFCTSTLFLLINKVKLCIFALFNQQPSSSLSSTPSSLISFHNTDPTPNNSFKKEAPIDQSTNQELEREDLKLPEKGKEKQKNSPIPTNSNISPSPLKLAKTQSDPIFYDNAGGGNCQLLAILKGLELQYPYLLKDLRKSQNDEKTAQQLRQMGVDFAREQIDTYGQYVESVLSYLDADRKEFNRVYIDPMKQKHDKILNQIEKEFKGKANYQKKLHEYKLNRANAVKVLKANTLIYTDELFLNSLEKPGFYCSTLHLFALSILLGIPIYVKEQLGVKNHDTQMFNPTECQKEPIHLYRVANRHYQYVFYP